MPDIGDFERDHHRHGGDIGWGEAFAALPQESPDAGGWVLMNKTTGHYVIFKN